MDASMMGVSRNTHFLRVDDGVNLQAIHNDDTPRSMPRTGVRHIIREPFTTSQMLAYLMGQVLMVVIREPFTT